MECLLYKFRIIGVVAVSKTGATLLRKMYVHDIN